MSWKEKLRYFLSGMAVLLAVAAYTFEFEWFNRTIDVARLVVGSLFVGAGAGWLLARPYARQCHGLTAKVQVYVFFIISCAVFAPLGGSLSNRWASRGNARLQPVIFVSQTPYFGSTGERGAETRQLPKGYRITFYRQEQFRTVKNPVPINPAPQRGDTVSLRFIPGFWGFDVAARNLLP